MNIRNPEINIPILQPEIVEAKQSEAPSLIKKTVETFSGWMNWLAESGKKLFVKPVSSALKNLKEKINKIFEDKKFQVREGQSALQNFVENSRLREKLVMILGHFLKQSEILSWRSFEKTKTQK